MPSFANLAMAFPLPIPPAIIIPLCSPGKSRNAGSWRLVIATALLCAMGACHATNRSAPLTVIHDSGVTVSIATYLEVLQIRTDPGFEEPVPTVPRISPAISFPVRTASMTPGRLAAQRTLALRLALPNPIFMLGTDPLSHQWLARNRTRLQQIGATGMVVEASSKEALHQLQNAASGLPMAVASADELAKLLRLSIYPILIERNGVISQ